MKAMITEDFYTDFEIYETNDLESLKGYVKSMENGEPIDLDESKNKLIATSNDIDTETALKMADKVIYISDYME